MKNNLLLSLILFLSVISYGQSQEVAEKAKIYNLIVESFDGIWSELDSENIEKYYTEDFLLLEHGEVWTNDTIAHYLDKAIMRKPMPERINKIEVIDIKITGKTAWIAYHNHAEFIVDQKIVRKAYWLESATAVLTDDGWKLDMLHSTRVKME
ncbi:nuclear transport factor 2 family protein [Mangrovivirga cuniculi]|uniref:DUF4440 domain-containing protein n=1 Tax=Mangrovivirga cuniculi TaxID=2715131 RepID=A0A4D7JSF2_9BACT|nr:nuclear transport factor 2 family protein [Mangrovivirga cuniculi]QCK15612.1 DUF4440 domain-containing protein [Mangrovivirga cuniculi]